MLQNIAQVINGEHSGAKRTAMSFLEGETGTNVMCAEGEGHSCSADGMEQTSLQKASIVDILQVSVLGQLSDISRSTRYSPVGRTKWMRISIKELQTCLETRVWRTCRSDCDDLHAIISVYIVELDSRIEATTALKSRYINT